MIDWNYVETIIFDFWEVIAFLIVIKVVHKKNATINYLQERLWEKERAHKNVYFERRLKQYGNPSEGESDWYKAENAMREDFRLYMMTYEIKKHLKFRMEYINMHKVQHGRYIDKEHSGYDKVVSGAIEAFNKYERANLPSTLYWSMEEITDYRKAQTENLKSLGFWTFEGWLRYKHSHRKNQINLDEDEID